MNKLADLLAFRITLPKQAEGRKFEKYLKGNFLLDGFPCPNVGEHVYIPTLIDASMMNRIPEYYKGFHEDIQHFFTDSYLVNKVIHRYYSDYHEYIEVHLVPDNTVI